MIVRVQGSGQYHLELTEIETLQGLDHQLVEAVNGHDEVGVHRLLHEMIELVQVKGVCLPDEELVTSDIVLPPDSLGIDEVQALLRDGSLLGTQLSTTA